MVKTHAPGMLDMFKILYDCDGEEMNHYLDVDMYAQTAEAPLGYWVVLGRAAGKGEGKAVATEGKKAAAKVAKMSAAEREALLQALQDAEDE